jgi:hypothetical protein
VFVSFKIFLQFNLSARMEVIPHLHASMYHVEKLADLLMLLLPIDPLTSPGTVHGGQAYIATSQYWRWTSGDATAQQTMQLLGMGMIAAGVECGVAS